MDINKLAEIEPWLKELPTKATWDDLALPSNCIERLREVSRAWQGQMTAGYAVLFAGPSGTGKTLAAEVIANSLGLPLYRIDLSLVVSKYIGETEKNLNALFDAAQDKDIVLLFVEADSLFGKREEIKMAHHLLDRIWQRQGLSILTSHSRENIDPVFTRRLQRIIEFPLPEAPPSDGSWRRYLRKRLWHTGKVILPRFIRRCINPKSRADLRHPGFRGQYT